MISEKSRVERFDEVFRVLLIVGTLMFAYFSKGPMVSSGFDRFVVIWLVFAIVLWSSGIFSTYRPYEMLWRIIAWYFLLLVLSLQLFFLLLENIVTFLTSFWMFYGLVLFVTVLLPYVLSAQMIQYLKENMGKRMCMILHFFVGVVSILIIIQYHTAVSLLLKSPG